MSFRLGGMPLSPAPGIIHLHISGNSAPAAVGAKAGPTIAASSSLRAKNDQKKVKQHLKAGSFADCLDAAPCGF